MALHPSPSALSTVLILAEEQQGTDLRKVAVAQSLRLLILVCLSLLVTLVFNVHPYCLAAHQLCPHAHAHSRDAGPGGADPAARAAGFLRAASGRRWLDVRVDPPGRVDLGEQRRGNQPKHAEHREGSIPTVGGD